MRGEEVYGGGLVQIWKELTEEEYTVIAQLDSSFQI
jgi:hypothetical protein